MKLNLPLSDNQLSDAIHRAKRAGMNEDKMYDMTADSIIQSFIELIKSCFSHAAAN
jgi:hypothetical protein